MSEHLRNWLKGVKSVLLSAARWRERTGSWTRPRQWLCEMLEPSVATDPWSCLISWRPVLLQHWCSWLTSLWGVHLWPWVTATGGQVYFILHKILTLLHGGSIQLHCVKPALPMNTQLRFTLLLLRFLLDPWSLSYVEWTSIRFLLHHSCICETGFK